MIIVFKLVALVTYFSRPELFSIDGLLMAALKLQPLVAGGYYEGVGEYFK